jgi:hypothetical protein
MDAYQADQDEVGGARAETDSNQDPRNHHLWHLLLQPRLGCQYAYNAEANELRRRVLALIAETSGKSPGSERLPSLLGYPLH